MPSSFLCALSFVYLDTKKFHNEHPGYLFDLPEVEFLKNASNKEMLPSLLAAIVIRAYTVRRSKLDNHECEKFSDFFVRSKDKNGQDMLSPQSSLNNYLVSIRWEIKKARIEGKGGEEEILSSTVTTADGTAINRVLCHVV